MNSAYGYLTTALLLATPMVHADPTAFPSGWDLSNIRNSTTSTLLSDTTSPKMVWVMPPTAGKVVPSGYTASTANLGFCQEMADLQGAARQIALDMKSNILKSKDATQDVKAKQDEYYRLKKAAEDFLASNRDLQKVTDLEDELASLEKKIDDLIAKQNECGNSDTPACKNIDVEIKYTQGERRKVKDELTDLRNKTRNDLTQYNRAKAKADDAQEEFQNALNYLTKINAFLIEGRKQILDMYEKYGRYEGGFANLNYETGWDENIQKLRTAYASYRFEKIPTDSVSVNIGFVGGASQDSYLASLPAILDYSVNGKSYLPWGDKTPQELGSFPSKMTASLRLSLVSGCAITHPEKFDIPKNAQGAPVFGIAATYQFPVSFSTKIHFSYNLYRFYELMKSSGTNGGLFSTSSWSKTSENHKDSSAFSADWKESDPDNQTPESQKQIIEKQVKEELMERVLKLMATPIFDGQSQPGSAPPVPKSGGLVLADGLEKTCGWYSFYCSGGAWILRGLDSIFGSSSSESDFKKSYDSTASETWNRQTIRKKPGVMVFATN